MNQQLDGLQITASRSRTKELALSEPARESEDVFIPLESTVKALKKIIKEERGAPTFIRAPVAAGKTTLALYLADKYKHEFVIVDLDDSEEGMRKNIVRAIKDNGVEGISNDSDFTDVLKAMAQSKKTLILDEAHVIFSFSSLSNALFKHPAQWSNTPRLKILLFSAADEYKVEQNKTPREIRKKYMWYPPMPDAKVLAEGLMEAGIVLDESSVLFFLKLCSGHRGIFMTAMDWVQRKQEKSNPSWNIHDTVAFVKASFARAKRETNIGWDTGLRKSMKESRAVRVNGQFSDIGNIPAELTEVVFGGAKRKDFFGEKLRALTIGGFLVPLRETSNDEFVRFDWTDLGKRYGVANSLMAEYYNNVFSADPIYCTQKLLSQCPSTAADLVARALPYMSFSTVVDNPLPVEEGDDKELSQTEKLKTPLSKSALPYKDNYNQAFAQMLNSLDYTVSTPFDPIGGKTDVVVAYDKQKTCGLECIMATRPAGDHNEHAKRFVNPRKSNYCNATLQGLITIGLDRETVCKRVKEISVQAERLEVIGLVVSAAHDTYEMYVRPKLSETKLQGPFFFVCDRVAKKLQPDESIRENCVVAAVELHNPKKRKGTDD